MADRQEHQPGTHAPVTGHYEELNLFGTPTGRSPSPSPSLRSVRPQTNAPTMARGGVTSAVLGIHANPGGRSLIPSPLVQVQPDAPNSGSVTWRRLRARQPVSDNDPYDDPMRGAYSVSNICFCRDDGGCAGAFHYAGRYRGWVDPCCIADDSRPVQPGTGPWDTAKPKQLRRHQGGSIGAL